MCLTRLGRRVQWASSARRAVRTPAVMSWLSPSRRYCVILNWVNEACDGPTMPAYIGASEACKVDESREPPITWLLLSPQDKCQVPGTWSQRGCFHFDRSPPPTPLSTRSEHRWSASGPYDQWLCRRPAWHEQEGQEGPRADVSRSNELLMCCAPSAQNTAK